MREENGLNGRWQFHGSGHHLSIDIQGCGRDRKEQYTEAVLEPDVILNVEPDYYIQPDDRLSPKEFYGMGVRIEDDILVTE